MLAHNFLLALLAPGRRAARIGLAHRLARVPSNRSPRQADGAGPQLLPRAEPPRVLVISGSVGAGHDGAATELARRLEARRVQVERRDFLDALPQICPRILRDGYAISVCYVPAFFEWLFRGIEDNRLVRWLVLRFCRLACRRVARWLDEGYDAVVTTYPLAVQTLGVLKTRGLVDVPVVSYLTDPAPHRLWAHPALDAHLTVTPATAAEGTARYRVPMRAAGPLAPAVFAEPLGAARRRTLRAELGVPPDKLMALLVTGSMGLGDVTASAKAVEATGLALPVVLCGRNERLRQRLDRRPGVIALGWRDDVPALMAAADVLVHNAGGLSLTEALVAGLPAVTYAPLPGHGRANADVLACAGIAPWPRTPAELSAALDAQARRGRVHVPRIPLGQDATGIVTGLAHRSRDQRGTRRTARRPMGLALVRSRRWAST